ncbi:NADH:ubiquinone reductase (Na(+)-transporting) subunit C [Salibacteraceae bacterium]|jgi:Na+-transporting NADH:ubiquinone oxidoreductase subunit C|nr:NADH:ubiquinone reductase (Na(+)-transporting) subunit C [Salibacteraceae bacterium]HAQ71726.1 NADH:ubiquinone reductase (Na(+)-transporting) subunit C [Flavobacteriales bacterium]MDA9267157.1 NADH:ubiquinone reductase (Na(+)-transporting) subunit C [Salibacteraceae bacterium]MDB0002542.1 NADH:ubiquinone reductase (Na(+)-transporting) subunit C [Salibacteraceae bacterium]MDB4104137.1 NADH:ubiquinone reductase (Na(+)-transporting) subunit C [Salibacteraceae bacterium]
MAFNKESQGFTFLFSIIMVVVVATVLAVAALGLKGPQEENMKQEKMQNVLGSIQVESSREEASAKFGEFIKKRVILDSEGNVLSETEGDVKTLSVDGKEAYESDAFNIDIKKQYRDKSLTDQQKRFPLFICEKDGNPYYVVPLVGTGLWGPIWGFIALEADMNTIFGATFDHKTETPGLGAEINQSWFEEPFVGDKIFDDAGAFVSVKVVKGGADAGDMHGVDAITGGTITSNGVSSMLENTLKVYVPYFKKNSDIASI